MCASRPSVGSGAEVRRVLMVSYEYPPLGGGGGVIFRDLAEELARAMDVTVLTSGRKGLMRRERRGAVEIVRVPVPMRKSDVTASLPSMLAFFPSSFHVGTRLLREQRFDLVHTSFAIPSGPSGLLLARRFHLPHVLSVQGGDVYDPSKALSPHRTPLLKQTVRWVIQGSDRVVAGSNDIRERAIHIYGAQQVGLIPLAARRPSFAPAPRSELGLDLAEEDFVLVTVGRLIPRKGLDELIEIVAELRSPRARLVIVGDGPERQALEAKARACGITPAVRFAGFVPEDRKWQILAASDLYVSTSLHEGFGIVFIEAMESGLPVICYDRGGQADFVTEDVGRLLPLGAADRLRAEIAHLEADPGLRSELGAAARRRAADYSVERYGQRYREVYRDCVGSTQTSRSPAAEPSAAPD